MMGDRFKSKQLQSWLTIGANLGVIIGLFMLIIEVQQNESLTRMQLEADYIFASQAVESSRMEPETARIWNKAIYSPETLEPFELTILDSFLAVQLQNWWLLLQMSEADLVSFQRVERAVINEAPFFFGNTFAKNWWRHEKNGWQGTTFRELVDPIINRQDSKFNASRMNDLLIKNDIK